MKIAIVSGGFDPAHEGHVELIRQAALGADRLVVGVNSDAWLARKKGFALLPFGTRAAVAAAIGGTNAVYASFDDSDNTACDLLRKVRAAFPYAEITFYNGGDRNHGSTPSAEAEVAKELGVAMEFGCGGTTKLASSSELVPLVPAVMERVTTRWGYYMTLAAMKNLKVKVLVFEPGKGISMQRHQHRSEDWQVLAGAIHGTLRNELDDEPRTLSLTTGDTVEIGQLVWHQFSAARGARAVVLEVQSGICEETDIERNPTP